jgi:peptidoglycan/LPS O-acetylase OafA/YrhL
MSGFLVYQSYQRSPHWRLYLIKRVRRLLPALIINLFITLLFFAFFISQMKLIDYLLADETYQFLGNIFFIFYPFLPGYSIPSPYPSIANGSLWSLPVEFYCYLLLALMAWSLKKIIFHWFMLFLGLMSLFAFQSEWMLGKTLFNIEISDWLIGIYFFNFGVLTNLWVPWLKSSPKSLLWGLGLFLVVATQLVKVDPIKMYLLVPILFMIIGQSPLFYSERVWKMGDPSYGMYLYSFPTQQILLFYNFPGGSFLTFVFLSVFISLILGTLSWFLCEVHFLQRQSFKKNHQ